MSPKLKLIIYSIVIFIAVIGVLYTALKIVDISSNEDEIDEIKPSLNV